MKYGIGIGIFFVFLIVTIILRMRAKSPWLGPLFKYELVKLARRGAQPRLRAVYAGLLLIGLLVIYLRTFSNVDPAQLLFDSSLQLPQNQKSNFTEAFTFTYLLVQILAVALITPVYAGGAIAEEKDRKSLDFLQSSLLSNREIVLGKLAARLTFVGCIVLVGMPVMFMTMLFGGLDEQTIFAGFTITFFTMLGLAGFSLLMGVYRKTLRDALYWPYGLLVLTTVFGYCCGCGIPGISAVSPFTALTMIFFNNASGGLGAGGIWGVTPEIFTAITLGIFCTLYGLMFLICTTLAIYSIRPAIIKPVFDPDTGRRASPRPKIRSTVVSAEQVIVVKPEQTAVTDPYDSEERSVPRRRPRTVRARRAFTVPPLRDGDPFLWKERHFSGRLPVLESGVAWGCTISIIVTFISVLCIVLLAGILVNILKGQLPGEVVNWCLRIFVTGTIIGLAPVIGLRAASSIAKERQQQTLLSLLGVPEARSRLLIAKWLAPLYGVRYWFIALAGSIIFALVMGGLHPLGVIAGSAYLAGFLPFANSFGLWLSVRSKTGTRAATIFLSTMLALVIGPPIFSTLFRAVFQIFSGMSNGLLAEHILDHINPIYGLWNAFADWNQVSITSAVSNSGQSDLGPISIMFTDTIIGVGYLALAAWFYWRAQIAFERETV